MRIPTTFLTASLAIALISQSACDKLNERWATTENTNVAIDWDKVNEAYKTADGPADFEKKVNEIYEGDEVISVSVQDLDGNAQVVTGFFDKDKSGTVQEEEKVFTIKRDVTGEGTGQYATQGYGAHYGYYHSPMMSLVTGMMMGSMISSAFRPNYVPMYRQPYTTPIARMGELHGSRSTFRAANPARFRPKMSGSNRSYGARPARSFGGGFRSGGARFGIRRRRSADRKPERLTA
ncbi:MAG: hypothetical protein EXR72_24300 [Myxococcales bacterium]|nr:hypothetical protein [Myxococcales bacterium]